MRNEGRDNGKGTTGARGHIMDQKDAREWWRKLTTLLQSDTGHVIRRSDATETDVLAMAQALEKKATELRAHRETMMIVSPVFRCSDCGRDWSAPMTIARERHYSPDNCPACFNAAKARIGDDTRSTYTETFRFTEEKRATAASARRRTRIAATRARSK